jgi:phosphoglycolate phosphatase-like HAD superfamily hydrolase
MMDHFADREAVFFDFDGVLVDSVAVKTRAFARLYEDQGPVIVERVVAYHLANGGVSRFKKFEHYERVLLGRAPTQARLAALGERFAAFVVEEVVASPEIPGAGALLARLKAAGTPCYVVSGTPEAELAAIVARRGMSDCFRSVRGSPPEKAEILAALVAKHEHRASDCLMIGDAAGDYLAASAAGMSFLGVVKSSEPSPFPSHAPLISSFETDLESAL